MKQFKKDFQKTISAIRSDYRLLVGYNAEYPKAMLTNQQMEKRTATVNCGGWMASPEKQMERAELVMNDPRFQIFLSSHSATAFIEKNSSGENQIRITY